MYESSDGSGEATWFSIDARIPRLRWVPASMCLEHCRGYAERFGGAEADPPYVLFGYFDGGCLLGVSRSSAEVWYFDPEIDPEPREIKLAPTLEAWLGDLIEAVTNGGRVWDEGEHGFVGFSATVESPPPPEGHLADIALANTLELLVQMGAVTLPESLPSAGIGPVRAALATKGFAARARKLRVALANAGARVLFDDSRLEVVLRVLG